MELASWVESAWALLRPVFVLFCLVGVGAAIFTLADLRSRLSSVEVFLGMCSVGMLVCSQLLIYIGLAEAFSPVVVIGIAVVGIAGWGLYFRYPNVPPSLEPNRTYWLPFVFLLGTAVMVLGSYADHLHLHSDAMQYHLALPWTTSITGGMLRESTLLHGGTYLGFDILYLVIADLSRLVESPLEGLEQLRLFSALTDALLPVSVYAICRAFGGSKNASAIAGLAVFSLGAIGYWAMLKNDIICAAIGVIALIFLVRANETKDKKILYLAVSVAAYAVTVKISNAAVLFLPFLYVYTVGGFSVKARAVGVLLGVLILAPWLINAYLATGNPISPIGTSLPAEVADAWRSRNANGIEPSFLNFFSSFLPVFMGWYQISGNEGLGWLALVVLAITVLVLIRSASHRKWALPEIMAASALLWFAFFYWSRYDGRFLSRYVLICFALMFGFVFARLQCAVEGRLPRTSISSAGFALIIVGVAVIQNPAFAYRYDRIKWLADWGSLRIEKEKEVAPLLVPYAFLNTIRGQEEAVAINDHMILFLEPPFVNVHAMHAAILNLYRKDLVFVKNLFSERAVKYLLFRKGISGEAKAISDYVDLCAGKVKEFGAVVLYKIRPSCQ